MVGINEKRFVKKKENLVLAGAVTDIYFFIGDTGIQDCGKHK